MPRMEVDTGRPPGHIGRGLGAIRALWSAWQALSFLSGVGKSISGGFCMRPYSFFIFHIIRTYEYDFFSFFKCFSLGAQPKNPDNRCKQQQAACREHAYP